jgi:hypothetical protein
MRRFVHFIFEAKWFEMFSSLEKMADRQKTKRNTTRRHWAKGQLAERHFADT